MNEEVKIVELGEAALLCLLGVSLERLEPSKNGVYKIFIFNGDKKEIAGHLDRYRKRDLQIDALTYSEAIKDLKKKIHANTDIL